MTATTGEQGQAAGAARRSGLARGWAVRDGAIYSVLSTNVVTLGMVELAQGTAVHGGQLVTSVLVSGAWVSFLVIAYAGLIVTTPRAGGDYVWQTRLLGGALGFVVPVTGLWFVLWLWAPIYGSIFSEEVFQPLAADLGQPRTAEWFASADGRFMVSLLTIVLAGLVVALGMAAYARVQLWSFGGALVGFAVLLALLLLSSHARFRVSADQYGQTLLGVKDAYHKAVSASPPGTVLGLGPLGASLRLVPMMMFYLLWPNTGSTLYGEVRDAGQYWRVLKSMLGGLWLTVVLSVAFLLAVDKTMGWAFYNGANTAWREGHSVLGIFPYPAMTTGWLVHDQAFQVALVLLMSLWFFGWVGTLFLGATRVIFAVAFDGALPRRVAHVTARRHVPAVALALMLAPAVGVSALYAYWPRFNTFTLDAVLVIAVTYFFSCLAVVLLPWRGPDLWRSSPARLVRPLGVPLVPVGAVVAMALIGFCLYEWLSNASYGVNNTTSLVFMGALYLLALAVYVVAHLASKANGSDLSSALRAVPPE